LSAPREVWICPPLDGKITGGTLCNARLLGALLRRGVQASRLDVEGARRALRSELPGRYWVDSLYLDRLPELAHDNTGGAALCLVVHYLPSLVRYGAVPPRSGLDVAERAALDAADAFLAPSGFVSGALAALGVPRERVVISVPGVDTAATSNGAGRAEGDEVRAVMVANVLPGKGVAAFLSALARDVADCPAFSLDVIGSVELDPEYAAECRSIVMSHELLDRAVRFEGSLPHEDVLCRLQTSDVFVSASRMEAFGLGLAEARAAGVPILARRGGNAAAHVSEAAGGELFDDDSALARGLVRVVRDAAERTRRVRLARVARTARTWDDAARDFVTGIQGLPARRSP
jgi:glycosyltransferase involved in cell wall biosynthesis